MKGVAAAVLYFAIVFGAGFMVGPLRVLYLEPRVGATAAVLLESPMLLLAMIAGAWAVLRWTRVAGPVPLLAVGVVALALQQCADVAVGILMRGMTVIDHVRQFATTPGMIYAVLLIAFMLMPLMVGLAMRRSGYDASQSD